VVLTKLTTLRLGLKRADFSPIPVNGKIPSGGWQNLLDVPAEVIASWECERPHETNTGILTKRTPTLDADLLDRNAAVAVEKCVRKWFEGRGRVLTRIGLAPKRAYPFRTETPFKKIKIALIAPDGSLGEKFEFLGDGQQVVCFGVHPDTGKAYRWCGPPDEEDWSPGAVRREELAEIDEREARQLLEELVKVVEQYGYRRVAGEAKDGEQDGERVDWGEMIGNIIDGAELHDSIRDLAASLTGCGVGAGAAKGILRAVMKSSTAPRDGRWQAGYDDIGRAVESAKKSFAQAPDEDWRIVSSAGFVADFVPPDYLLDGVLQRGFLYALTGRTGEGKTAVALDIAALVGDLEATSRLGDHALEHGRVLYLAGENPDDIRMRWIAMSERMGFEPDAVDVHFLFGHTTLSQDIERIAAQVEELGGVQLIVVDTARAFFEGDNENDNKQQGDYARQQLRRLTGLAGRPCVLVNCHPSKHAADDNMQPVGGGAFVAEIDGNLTCMSDRQLVELHWQTKLRGPNFLPLKFELKQVTTPKLKDSKGRLITTVVAQALSEKRYEQRVAETLSEEERVLDAMVKQPKASIAQLAETLGWMSAKGEPNKARVHRVLQKLAEGGLVKKYRGVYRATEKGEKAAKKARDR
jgi:hypothetical protein